MNNYLRILEYLNQFIDTGKFHIIENLGKDLKLEDEDFKRLLNELKSIGYIEIIKDELELDFSNRPEFGNIVEVKLQGRITLPGNIFLINSLKK